MAKCPRCNTEITNSVCPECGWLEITFPKFPEGKLPQGISDAIERSREVYNQKKQEKEALLKEIEELKAKQNAAAVTNTGAILPVGIIIFSDEANDFQSVAPIYPGLNTYGNDESKDNHHKVFLGVFGGKLAPQHFSVVADEKHFLLKDLTGKMGLKSSGFYAEGKAIKVEVEGNNDIDVKFLKIF